MRWRRRPVRPGQLVHPCVVLSAGRRRRGRRGTPEGVDRVSERRGERAEVGGPLEAGEAVEDAESSDLLGGDEVGSASRGAVSGEGGGGVGPVEGRAALACVVC